MEFPPISIPTSMLFDGFQNYSNGDNVGVTVSTDIWQPVTAGAGVVIDDTIYVPGLHGPDHGGAVYRKESISPNQWVATQMVIPFTSPDSAIGVRIQPNGDGYYLNNVFYGGESAPPADTYFHYTTVSYPGGPTPYQFYATPQLVASANEILMGELGLYRVINGQSTLIGYWANFGATCPQYNSKPLCWLDVNQDGDFFMLEVIGDNPVKLRVSIIYLTPPTPYTVAPLPGYSIGIMEIGQVTDSSASRITSGQPGMSGFNSSAGAYFGFNAGKYNDFDPAKLTVASTIDTITMIFGGGTFIIDKMFGSSIIDNLSLVEPPGLARTLTGEAILRNLDGSIPEIYTLGGSRWN